MPRNLDEILKDRDRYLNEWWNGDISTANFISNMKLIKSEYLVIIRESIARDNKIK